MINYQKFTNCVSDYHFGDERRRCLVHFHSYDRSTEQKMRELRLYTDKLSQIKASTMMLDREQAKYLEKLPCVKAIELDGFVRKLGETIPVEFTQISADDAWNNNLTGEGINIAVIDTGIGPHEDLIVKGGACFLDGGKPCYRFYDDNGHGTHVAGIIGATHNDIGIRGVANGANLYAVKVLDETGSGNIIDVIYGINWAIENNMDIINLSLGTTENNLGLKEICQKAINQGIIIVAASGNDGTSGINYPAKYKSVISVGAVDDDNRRASFSSYGNDLDFVAPGVSVLAPYLNNSYTELSGTSMAAPFCTGTIALIAQQESDLSFSQVKSILKRYSKDLGKTGKDVLYGDGLIRVPILK